MLSVAVPELRVTEPRFTPPSEKLTEPVGVIEPDEGLTVEVSVRVPPVCTGFGVADSDVVVPTLPAAVTVIVMADEAELLKPVAPAYVAVAW